MGLWVPIHWAAGKEAPQKPRDLRSGQRRAGQQKRKGQWSAGDRAQQALTGACRRAASHSAETPAHRHIRSQFRTRQMPPERCGLRPRPLMCFQGVQGVPRYCQKELPAALCSHRAWAFLSWTGRHSTHLRAWLLSQLFQNAFLLLKYQELQFNGRDPAPRP